MGWLIDGARIALITSTLLAIATLTKPEAVDHYKGKATSWWQQTILNNDSTESNDSSPTPSDENDGNPDDWGF